MMLFDQQAMATPLMQNMLLLAYLQAQEVESLALKMEGDAMRLRLGHPLKYIKKVELLK